MIAWAWLACAPPADRDAETCGGCHPAELEAWSATGHAAGADQEVLAAWLPEVRRAWGEAAERRCVACHAPGYADEPVVGCLACHGAVGNRGEADGALIVDERGPLGARGAVEGAPHGVTDRAFLLSSSLCATCHEVTGPALLDERTGSEHAASGRPESCADCHLPDGDHDLRPRWEGALRLELHRSGGELEVAVTNVGAAHAVPTGAAFLRELRVELAYDGEDGTEVVLELAPRPTDHGDPVPLPTDGDAIEGGGLGPGETRSAWVEVPEDVDVARARVVFRRFRPEVLHALDLPDTAGGPEEVVAEATLPL